MLEVVECKNIKKKERKNRIGKEDEDIMKTIIFHLFFTKVIHPFIRMMCMMYPCYKIMLLNYFLNNKHLNILKNKI